MLEADGAAALEAELERLKPAELLVPEDQSREIGEITHGEQRVRPPWHFEFSSASRLLTDQLGTLDLRGFGADDLPLAISAAGALLQYVRETQKTALPHITTLAVEERGDALHLDAATRRNLEIDVSLSGQDSATLFALLDSTVTPMGSRNLRRWLNRPLTDQQELRRRYQADRACWSMRAASKALREPLRAIGDVERILSRVALRSARPRDLTVPARVHRGAAGAARQPQAHRSAADHRTHELGERTRRRVRHSCSAPSPKNRRWCCATAT